MTGLFFCWRTDSQPGAASGPWYDCRATIIPVNENSASSRLLRVLDQLRLYEHPLLRFDARQKNEGVEVVIELRNPQPGIHAYYFDIHARDLDSPQFEWQFQRQLYDCLHDYLIEMFIRTPQDRAERRARG